MDSPAPAPLAAATIYHCPDSFDSSPRSRTTDTNEGGSVTGDPLPGGAKLRLMCRYGGHIIPRPHDNSLCYVGGDTRIVVVDRNSTLPELLQRLSRILLSGRSFTLKYQLPNEDLDSLITVSSEEDLENMIDEYDRLSSGSNAAKPSRIRLFLFPAKLEVAASMGPILDGSNKSDDWFLNALNGADILQRGYSDPASAHCLLGLDSTGSSGNLGPNSKEIEGGEERGLGLGGGNGNIGNMSNQDVHSVHDSPAVETTSSFGSTSSSPSLANLPPIRVQVEGARVFDQRIGIEEQFALMGVGVQKQEEGFAMMSSPPTVPPNFSGAGVVAGEYTDRMVSDDERSDHGVPVGYRKPPPAQTVAYQAQPKQMSGDLPSPDSTASDSSLSNAISRQKPALYQDPSAINKMPANFIDPNTGAQIQVQQVSDSGYMLPPQYELHQQQQQQQQQQQYYVPGGVPVSYYPVYPSQQPQNHHKIDQRFPPVYYVPAGQAHAAYNLPVQQPSYGEVGNVVPAYNMPPPKAEMAQAGVYGTTTIQVPSHQQQQFVGYSQIHHPSQSIAPNSVGPTAAGYGYELADPAHTQLYFTQPQMAAQYQTMVLSDISSAGLPTEPVNPQ